MTQPDATARERVEAARKSLADMIDGHCDPVYTDHRSQAIVQEFADAILAAAAEGAGAARKDVARLYGELTKQRDATLAMMALRRGEIRALGDRLSALEAQRAEPAAVGSLPPDFVTRPCGCEFTFFGDGKMSWGMCDAHADCTTQPAAPPAAAARYVVVQGDRGEESQTWDVLEDGEFMCDCPSRDDAKRIAAALSASAQAGAEHRCLWTVAHETQSEALERAKAELLATRAEVQRLTALAEERADTQEFLDAAELATQIEVNQHLADQLNVAESDAAMWKTRCEQSVAADAPLRELLRAKDEKLQAAEGSLAVVRGNFVEQSKCWALTIESLRAAEARLAAADALLERVGMERDCGAVDPTLLDDVDLYRFGRDRSGNARHLRAQEPAQGRESEVKSCPSKGCEKQAGHAGNHEGWLADTFPEPQARDAGEYRKKPVVIKAWRWDGSTDWKLAPEWLQSVVPHWSPKGITIPTLEGNMTALPGDWIIRGIKDEVYPCKPDIFEASYEPAARIASALRGEGEAWNLIEERLEKWDWITRRPAQDSVDVIRRNQNVWTSDTIAAMRALLAQRGKVTP